MQDCAPLQLKDGDGGEWKWAGVETLLSGSVGAEAALQPPHGDSPPLSGVCSLFPWTGKFLGTGCNFKWGISRAEATAQQLRGVPLSGPATSHHSAQ